MKILLLTSDFDGPGVGYDVKFSRSVLNDKFTTYVFHFGKRNEPENKIFSFNRKKIFQSYKIFKKNYWSFKIDIAHIRGIMSFDHIIWFFFLIFTNSKYVVSPNSQINDYNLNNKLFYENPDFKNNDKNQNSKESKNIIKKIFLKIYFTTVPIMKKIYLYSLGILFIKKSKGLICFSNFEKKFAEKYKKNTIVVYEPNLIKEPNSFTKKEINKIFEFNKDNINLIYWGRLDYKLKGIDRLLAFARSITQIDKKNIIKFHLMGPDYNFVNKKILLEIDKLNLNNKVFIHPESVWMGNKEPLICADYSILLGRWDGFPRALRESIHYSVPIIITEETNFADLVRETDCGVILNQNKEDQINFASKLIENRNSTIASHKDGCRLAQNKISTQNYMSELSNFYKNIVRSLN